MKNKIIISSVVFLFTIEIKAQELNLGVHLNPTLSIPVIANNSSFDKQIKVYPIRVGYNIGANINFTYDKINLETGINIVQKSIEFRQSVPTTTRQKNYFKVISNSTSFEFPLLLAYNIHQHDKRFIYKMFLIGGASYELYSADGYHSRSKNINSSNYHLASQSFTIPQTYDENNWFNIIAGFKINAIINKIGLIDYGLTYHFPLKTNDPYHIESSVFDYANNQSYTYKGDYSARLSYVDIKLCYYFLNFDNSFRRIKYKQKI